ncbi:PAS domain-containing protein [Brevundimonas sp.]|uniref:PAS domain-containing protein n=1 Tax=Brevundimonas sp. TaxID=1871086 RepID=UPI00391D6ADE
MTQGETTPASALETTVRYTLPPELVAVLNASPDIQVLLAPDQTVLFANTAYQSATPPAAGPLVGHSLADSLLGRDARRATSRRVILDAVRRALTTGEVVQPPVFRYDIQNDPAQAPREAWWRLCASPFELQGSPCLLVTAAITMGRGAGEDSVTSPDGEPGGALLWAERRRLSQMFEQTSDMMALLVGPDLVFELINPALQRALGDRRLLGRSVRDIVQAEQGRELVRRLDEVRASGLPFRTGAQPLRLTPEAEEDHFLDLTLQPLSNEDGKVEAIFCRGQDVTEQVRAQAVQRFLREELAHRQGNILAVVLAIAEQAAAQTTSLERFRTTFAGRLSAVAAVNCLLNRHGPDVSLADIFSAVARPLRERHAVSGSGRTATLTPKAAITLGLMFHELLQVSGIDATPGSTRPRIRAHQRAGRLHLIWMAPDPVDFGEDADNFARRLIDHAVRHEFGGSWVILRRKKGAAICFEFPLTHSAWTRSGAVA